MSVFRNIQNDNIIEEVNLTGFYRGRQAKVFEILGRRTTFLNNLSQHDISDAISSFVFPTVTSAEALQIVSTSTSDTLAGIGIQTVRVIYIDASNNLVASDVILNGTTAVAVGFTANEIISMEAIACGSNTVAVGDIILRKVAGSVALEKITLGSNKSMSAKFMIPQGYTGYLLGGNFAAISQTMDFRLRATVRTFDRALNVPYVFQQNYFLATGQNSGDMIYHFLKYPALSRIKISAIAGATGGNPRGDCSFTILIIQD